MSESKLLPERSAIEATSNLHSLRSYYFFWVVSSLPLELQQDIFYIVLSTYEAYGTWPKDLIELEKLIEIIVFITGSPKLCIEIDNHKVRMKILFRESWILYETRKDKKIEDETTHMLQSYIRKFEFYKLVALGHMDFDLKKLFFELVNNNPTYLTVLWRFYFRNSHNIEMKGISSKITSIKGAFDGEFYPIRDSFPNLKKLELYASGFDFTEEYSRLIHNMSLSIDRIVMYLYPENGLFNNIRFKKLLMEHKGGIKFLARAYYSDIDESFNDIWQFNIIKSKLDVKGKFDPSILSKLTGLKELILPTVSGSFASKSVKIMDITSYKDTGDCDFSNMMVLEDLAIKGDLSRFNQSLNTIGNTVTSLELIGDIASPNEKLILPTSIINFICHAGSLGYFDFDSCTKLKRLGLYELYGVHSAEAEVEVDVDWDNLPSQIDTLELYTLSTSKVRNIDIHIEFGDKFKFLKLNIIGDRRINVAFNDIRDFSRVPSSSTEEICVHLKFSCSRTTKLELATIDYWKDAPSSCLVILPAFMSSNIRVGNNLLSSYCPSWVCNGKENVVGFENINGIDVGRKT